MPGVRSDVDRTISPDPFPAPMNQEELSVAGLFDFGDKPALDLADLQPLDQYAHSGLADASEQLVFNDFMGQSSLLDNANRFPESQELAIGNPATSHFNSATKTGFLTLLHAPEPLVKQSENLVMEALCAVPEQMIRRETLPSFIHPHWGRRRVGQIIPRWC